MTRFQQAYGLSADGVAGPQTFTGIYALQDGDCTPANFSYAELNTCHSSWSGGAVDLGSCPHSLCTLARQARNHGFRGILGPGHPGHSDHTHVDHRSSRFWSASGCGI